MADATFTLRVKQFFELSTGKDCPYDLDPPKDGTWKNTPSATDSLHEYPTWTNDVVSLHVGHYQKAYTYKPKRRIPTTIRLEKGRALLRLDIVDQAGGQSCYPVGIAFFRADGTDPVGSPYTTGANPLSLQIQGADKNSPFSRLKMNEPWGTIEVHVERIAKLFSKGRTLAKPNDQHTKNTGSHRTYRFFVFIQDLGSGQIGVIDPEIEPPV